MIWLLHEVFGTYEHVLVTLLKKQKTSLACIQEHIFAAPVISLRMTICHFSFFNISENVLENNCKNYIFGILLAFKSKWQIMCLLTLCCFFVTLITISYIFNIIYLYLSLPFFFFFLNFFYLTFFLFLLSSGDIFKNLQYLIWFYYNPHSIALQYLM